MSICNEEELGFSLKVTPYKLFCLLKDLSLGKLHSIYRFVLPEEFGGAANNIPIELVTTLPNYGAPDIKRFELIPDNLSDASRLSLKIQDCETEIRNLKADLQKNREWSIEWISNFQRELEKISSLLTELSGNKIEPDKIATKKKTPAEEKQSNTDDDSDEEMDNDSKEDNNDSDEEKGDAKEDNDDSKEDTDDEDKNDDRETEDDEKDNDDDEPSPINKRSSMEKKIYSKVSDEDSDEDNTPVKSAYDKFVDAEITRLCKKYPTLSYARLRHAAIAKWNEQSH